nr:UMP kinase [Spirochaetota bacterium]
GHPFFTTDTAASLRAVELGADAVFKATRVDGVYTGDPEKDSNARRIDSISFLDVIKNQLRVMDLTAVSLCMENGISIVVFNLFMKGSLGKILSGEKIGTIIS